jgi:hypothetical protein
MVCKLEDFFLSMGLLDLVVWIGFSRLSWANNDFILFRSMGLFDLVVWIGFLGYLEWTTNSMWSSYLHIRFLHIICALFAFNVGLHSTQIKMFYIVQPSWHWCDDRCGLVHDFYKNFRGLLCLEFLNFRMEDPLAFRFKE